MSHQTKPPVEHSCEPRLLAAALAGLLSLTACGKAESNSNSSSTGGAASSGGNTSTTGGFSAGGSSSGGASTGGAPSTGGDASSAGSAGAAGAGGATVVPEITSSTEVLNLDADGFKALCDARNGTVEIMPHCGGFATARGFSYDTSTSLLSEHTCKGANTCGGWNCVTDE